MSNPPAGQPAIRVTAMPADANFYGDIFGGWLMGMMDLAAGNVASRRSAGRAVTVAIDAVSSIIPCMWATKFLSMPPSRRWGEAR